METEQGSQGTETTSQEASAPAAEEGRASFWARTRWIRRGLGVALGAAAGFAYYSYVGCHSGGCPIWQDPTISAGFGALIGGLAIW